MSRDRTLAFQQRRTQVRAQTAEAVSDAIMDIRIRTRVPSSALGLPDFSSCADCAATASRFARKTECSRCGNLLCASCASQHILDAETVPTEDGWEEIVGVPVHASCCRECAEVLAARAESEAWRRTRNEAIVSAATLIELASVLAALRRLIERDLAAFAGMVSSVTDAPVFVGLDGGVEGPLGGSALDFADHCNAEGLRLQSELLREFGLLGDALAALRALPPLPGSGAQHALAMRHMAGSYSQFLVESKPIYTAALRRFTAPLRETCTNVLCILRRLAMEAAPCALFQECVGFDYAALVKELEAELEPTVLAIGETWAAHASLIERFVAEWLLPPLLASVRGLALQSEREHVRVGLRVLRAARGVCASASLQLRSKVGATRLPRSLRALERIQARIDGVLDTAEASDEEDGGFELL
eukprot:c3728_g1_i1.p1 GENE.c3728_g1_i1~~c3728_g1_i1.p1  ORF type:complete len:418 (+),score=71.33 c3728_g1_i1:151-1404(+)